MCSANGHLAKLGGVFEVGLGFRFIVGPKAVAIGTIVAKTIFLVFFRIAARSSCVAAEGIRFTFTKQSPWVPLLHYHLHLPKSPPAQSLSTPPRRPFPNGAFTGNMNDVAWRIAVVEAALLLASTGILGAHMTKGRSG